jgi:hypothetical protein
MCQERIVEVLDALQTAKLTENIDIVCFGTGTRKVGARVLRGFNQSGTLRMRMFVDQERAFFKQMSLYRGIKRTFTWTRWANVMGLCAMPKELAK